MTAAQRPPRHQRALTAALAVALAAAAAQLWASAPPRTHALSLPRGPFPCGCVWRSKGRAVEFAVRRGWSATPPPACTAAATTQPWGGAGRVGGINLPPPPPTSIACGWAACTLTHAWLSGGGPTLHSLHPSGWRHATHTTQLTRNTRLAPLALGDAAAFAGAAAPRVAGGTTLVVDFTFFKKHGAIAHWAEVGAQIVASLAESEGEGGGGASSSIARVVLLHAPRAALTPWVRTALAAALNTTTHLPPIIVQVDGGSAEGQVGALLEGDDSAAASGWLLLERAIVPRDVFTGGRRTFHTPAAAATWRAAFHEAAGVALPPPGRHGNHMPTILLLRKSADRRILNEAALVEALTTVGIVTQAEWTSETGVASQLAEIAAADILVSTHTSALAAVQLVRPGTTIIELIPRNWAWGGLDTSFRDAAAARGGVLHAAWRARARAETVPETPRDGARFGHWTPSQCVTEACVHAAAAADVVVDVGAVCAMVINAARGDPLPPWPAP